ncbi:MAG TPA: response regulator [Thermodesulfovibrionales bacterium]|nr:response regulator [Thermodesulfovibrionales bacterium]
MKKMIIIDSLSDFVEQNAAVITGYDNKILYAKSGREALDMHRAERADLLITTLDLPDITCEELCQVIRHDEMLKRISILVICSSGQSDIERCMRCGASDYQAQPLSPSEFLWKVTRLLNVSERTSYRVVVKVTKNDVPNAPHIFCSSKNISSSGVLLETDQVFNIGEKLTCSFFLPHSVRIITEGQVMRLRRKEDGSSEYGVRFVDPSASVELQIASFVENWLKRKKDVSED